jgi:hypothetical protein
MTWKDVMAIVLVGTLAALAGWVIMLVLVLVM